MKCLNGCLVLGVLSFLGSAVAETRPNILFVLCDDLRPAALGCYGSQTVKTPQIDRLAADGVRFANAFCTTSLCSPSRASILTGLYAHAHGVTNNFTELPDSLETFPKRLKLAGYKTAYVGKWHMGEENDAPRPGFDYFVSHKGQGSYFDTEFNLNGVKREVVKGYYTKVVTDFALEWMKKQNQDTPWCMMIGHKAPHSFYTPEPKYAHAFDDVRVPYPASASKLDDKPTWIKERLTTWHGIYGPLFDWRKKFPDSRPEAVTDFENMVHGYWGTILSVDDSLGQIRAWLEETGQWEHTIVLFMGDNGLLEGEHGMVDKRTAHEPSMRIPIITRIPGSGAAGKVIKEQVLTVDVAPSLLEAAGLDAMGGIHGRSWIKLIKEGADPHWRRSVLYYYNYEKQFPYTPNVRAVRTDDWKYIHYPPGDGTLDKHMAELYYLKTDPDEMRNLANDPVQLERLDEMQAELTRAMSAVGLTPATDKMPLDEGIKKELPDQKIR